MIITIFKLRKRGHQERDRPAPKSIEARDHATLGKDWDLFAMQNLFDHPSNRWSILQSPLLMTMLVVWLLKIPGLLFVGGAMLVWIAYKLLLQEDGNGNGNGTSLNGAGTLSGAIKTIVVADMVMGLDNVLGVAGAAQGSFLLVVLGLLISIPILIWGSSMLLRLVERFPGFVYLGAGVLALTAAKMITAEPHLKDHLAAYTLTLPLLYVVTVFSVLWAGFVKNHR